jgi:hypothetical protein
VPRVQSAGGVARGLESLQPALRRAAQTQCASGRGKRELRRVEVGVFEPDGAAGVPGARGEELGRRGDLRLRQRQLDFAFNGHDC